MNKYYICNSYSAIYTLCKINTASCRHQIKVHEVFHKIFAILFSPDIDFSIKELCNIDNDSTIF